MYEPLRNLNGYIGWQRLLPALGMECSDQSLPATVRCPECGFKQLLIVQDYPVKGQWHYCTHCGLTGDMIQLAAKVWDLGLRGALLKLESLGFQIPRYAEDRKLALRCYEKYLGRQKRFAKLWREASDGRIFDRKEPRTVLAHMQVGTTHTRKLSHEATGIMGSHTTNAVIDAMKPGVRDRRESRNGKFAFHSSSGGIYKGAGWSEVVILPFYDLPNRISMFRTWGHHGRDRQLGEVCVRRTRRHMDPGLSFDLSLLQRKKRTVYAFGDHVRYLRLQLKSMKLGQGVLPLALWHSDDKGCTRRAWKMLQHHRIILWSETLTPEVMLQAILANGYICHTNAGSGKKHQIDQLFTRDHLDILARMRKQGKHWTKVLDRFCQEAAEPRVEEMLLYLQAENIDIERVLAACHSRTADLARDVLSGDGYRQLRIGRHPVIEQNGCWYREDVGHEEPSLISNCTFRLDALVRYPNSDVMHYRGRAMFQGQEIPFIADVDKFEYNPLRWIRNELVARNIGVVSYASSWSRKSLDIAKLCKTPKLVTGVDRVGWDPEKSALSFPRFELEFGGRVRETNGAYLPGLPAHKLAAPDPNFGVELHPLAEDTPFNRHFWAFLTHIAANLLAPACNRSKRGLVFSGQLADQVAAAVTKCLGLSRVRLATISDGLIRKETAHDIPLVAHTNVAAFDYDAYLHATEGERNVLLSCRARTAMLLGINTNWCVMPSEDDSDPGRVPEHAISLALPMFLHYMMSRRLSDMHRDYDHWKLVQDAARGWFQHLGFNPRVLTGAERLLLSHDKTALPLELLSLPYRTGQLQTEPAEFEAQDRLLTLGRDDLFIPEPVLRAIGQSNRPEISIDYNAVTKLLSASPDYVGEDFINNQNGWVIKQSWWNKTIRRTSERKTPRLKVVS